MSEEKKEEKKSKPLFDVNRQIDIKLQAPGGGKVVTLRFPTDPEWCDRQRKRKIIIKQLGRGMSETIAPDSSDIDFDLVQSLRVGEDGPEIDGYEATRILEDLSLADVDDVEPEGDSFRVFLRVAGDMRTTHVLAMPSAKDIIQFRRAFARGLDLPFNKQRLTINLEAAGELDKKLRKATEGYASAVPIIHQAAVVKAVIDMIESGSGVAGSENF